MKSLMLAVCWWFLLLRGAASLGAAARRGAGSGRRVALAAGDNVFDDSFFGDFGGGAEDEEPRSSSSSSSFAASPRERNNDRGGRSVGGDRGPRRFQPIGRGGRDRPPRRDAGCFVCGEVGHISTKCPQRADKDRGNGGGGAPPRRQFGSMDQKCFNCGNTGHRARDCPEPRKEPEFTRTRVFVGSLGASVEWTDLKDHFRDAGYDVVFSSISTDYDGSPKGHGLVQFGNADEARRAIEEMDGSSLGGQAISIREDRQDGQRRQERRDRAPAPQENDRRNSDEPWTRRGADLPGNVAAVERLLVERDEARRARDYPAADSLRDIIQRDHKVRTDDRNREWYVETPRRRNNAASFSRGGDYDDDGPLWADPVDPPAKRVAAKRATDDLFATRSDEASSTTAADEAFFDTIPRLFDDDVDVDEAVLPAKKSSPKKVGPSEDAGARGAELKKLTVPVLKDILRPLKLKLGGTKAELIGRILDHEASA